LARALAETGAQANPADVRMVVIDALEETSLLSRELSPDIKQRLVTMPAADVSVALAEALRHNRFSAAARLAEDLGARGDAAILATSDGQPSPLAAGLKSPVRTVRFAALQAIMQLAPSPSFAGASGVADALWYFAAGAGRPAALAAAPVFTRASDWAGQLRGLGYDAVPASTGRGALTAALDPAMAPRLGVVLIDGDIGQPLVREVVFQLRSADRTAQVPIIIASSAGHLADAERIAEEAPLVVAAPRPHGVTAIQELVDRAVALPVEPMADAPRRTAQAAQALDWLATLLTEGLPYDELRRDARLVNRLLFTAELNERAIRVLAALGTAESQAALADYASAPALPIEGRRRAADALADSLARFGAQLTSDQILRQYDRYNASETADAETQDVLGGILDALEGKARL
jgi:hypothetical protein